MAALARSRAPCPGRQAATDRGLRGPGDRPAQCHARRRGTPAPTLQHGVACYATGALSVPALSERLRAYDRKLRCGELPESPDHRGLRKELLPRDACASNAGGAPFAVEIRSSSHGRFEWEELLCPGSSPRLTYIAACSKRKSPKDRALLEPLERPPYRQRRSGTSLGHLKHGVSWVWAVVHYPGVGRYESVKPRLKLDPPRGQR